MHCTNVEFDCNELSYNELLPLSNFLIFEQFEPAPTLLFLPSPASAKPS